MSVAETQCYSVAFQGVRSSKWVTSPQRFENKCPLEIWQDKGAPGNAKGKPTLHSFYFADVKQILYFKAFHFSRSNWGFSRALQWLNKQLNPLVAFENISEGRSQADFRRGPIVEQSKFQWLQELSNGFNSVLLSSVLVGCFLSLHSMT